VREESKGMRDMRVEELLSMVFEVDPTEGLISESTVRTDLEGWDSLMHLSVVAAAEETYNITFSTAEMAELDSVASIRRILKSKGIDA
jgi:acyl carrier protein